MAWRRWRARRHVNAIGVVDSTVQEDTRIRASIRLRSRTRRDCRQRRRGLEHGPRHKLALGLDFTDTGPRAYGLLSYSQSSDAASPFYDDQQRRYADKDPRQIPFTEKDITSNLLPNGTITIKGP